MTQPINISRFQNKLRALMGLRGENPIPTIKELLPIVVMESDRPEWEQPGGEMLWMTFASLAAVAGNTGHYVLWNPPGSGLLQIVTRAWVNQVGTLGSFFWSRVDPTTIAAFIATAVIPRDARAFGKTGFSSPIPMQFYRGSLTAAEIAAYATSGSTRFPAMETTAQTFDPWGPDEVWVVPEGWGFGFQTNQANFASSFQIMGRQHTQERGIPS